MDMALLDPCDIPWAKPEGTGMRTGHAQSENQPVPWTMQHLTISKFNSLCPILSPSIPALSPHAYTISPFRHGYTGRRAGEAGPALVVAGRRES